LVAHPFVELNADGGFQDVARDRTKHLRIIHFREAKFFNRPLAGEKCVLLEHGHFVE
jgi:hypothetical protein